MCMEDVRLGRQTCTGTAIVDCPAGQWTRVAARNLDRYALMVRSSTTSGIMYACGAEGAPTVGTGSFGGDQHPLDLSIQIHGDMTCQEWYVYADATNNTVYVTETTLAKQ